MHNYATTVSLLCKRPHKSNVALTDVWTYVWNLSSLLSILKQLIKLFILYINLLLFRSKSQHELSPISSKITIIILWIFQYHTCQGIGLPRLSKILSHYWDFPFKSVILPMELLIWLVLMHWILSVVHVHNYNVNVGESSELQSKTRRVCQVIY